MKEQTTCNCRLEVSDMGYLECELEKDHVGNHQFTHNGETWPKKKISNIMGKRLRKRFYFLRRTSSRN